MSSTHGRDRKIRLEKLKEHDALIRGRYLVSALSLNSIIQDIIAYHFCPPGQDEKRRQFISLILVQHSKESQIIMNILERIVTTNYSDQLEKYPTLFKDLQIISDYTLWLSSSVLDPAHEPKFIDQENIITLSNYDQKGQPQHIDVSVEEIEERISDCQNIHFALEDIRSEIRDRILTESR